MDPNPDPRTFEALELLIKKVHAAGGVTHIWAWGDEQRHMTTVKWGINGSVDRRLQRYICARLGPLPGWSMGYGFDLQEWVTSSQLQNWHQYMHQHFGWSHYLGARAPDMTQIYDGMDYSSYQQHRPTYDTYVQGIEQLHSGKPTFFEDRFRVRENVYPDKDYTEEMTRRGLYHSTMAGGAANIWGYLIPSSDNDASLPYPNKHWLLTYSRFFGAITAPMNNHRFNKNMVRDNSLTDGVCLKVPGSQYIFYKENTNFIQMNLTGMSSPKSAVAVDTVDHYEEIPLGTLNPGSHTYNAPYISDWIIAVGDPAPADALYVDLGRVDEEAGVYRRDVGDGNTEVVEKGGKLCRQNQVGDSYMYFSVSGAYSYQGSRTGLYITVEYFDQGTAALSLQYDSTTSAYTDGGSVNLTNTNTWKQHIFHVTDAYCGNRQNGDADFRISGGSSTFYLNSVQVWDQPPGPPSKASNPDPTNGAVGVETEADLSWSGGSAVEYDVYFGPAGSVIHRGRQSQNYFDPGIMESATQYQWRIDSINEFGTTNGDIWTFTTVSVAADFDGDGDVDQEDFGYFQRCMSGFGVALDPGCEDADLNGDGDVDFEDFAVFQTCMSGPGQTPGC